jgi:hypothetical protein
VHGHVPIFVVLRVRDRAGVLARRAHSIHTVAPIRGQALVNHPKHPPKQPIEPQKTLVASTTSFFLVFMVAWGAPRCGP